MATIEIPTDRPGFQPVRRFLRTGFQTGGKFYDESQMQQAARDLREGINSGKVDVGQFAAQQLKDIQAGFD